jgi:predicted small lipoprotein YifL
MSRSLKICAVLVFAALSVTACGKRGTLERPSSYEGEKAAPAAKAQPEEHRGTILDGLLL